MENFKNQIKECSMEVLIETYKLTKDYQRSAVDRMIRLKGRLEKMEQKFNECPTIEMNKKLTEIEGRFYKVVKDISDMSDMLIAIKYEIMTREV